MFGNNASGLTMVYEYGAKAPTKNLADAQIEMCLRVRLWNALVAIERPFREEYRRLTWVPLDNEIASLKAKRDELKDIEAEQKQDAAFRTISLHRARQLAVESLEQIKKVRAGLPTESPKQKKYKAIPGMLFEDFQYFNNVTTAIGALRSLMKPIYDAAKIDRDVKREENAEAIKALSDQRSADVKKARQESGLYWGNSGDIIASYESARIAAAKIGAQLHFQKPDGEGKITVQFTTALSRASIFQDEFRPDGQFQLSSLPEQAFDRNLGRARKKLQWVTARIRIRSYEKQPVWLEMPVCIHRPLPDNCTIQMASVVFRNVGNRAEYKLSIIVRMPEPKKRTTGDSVKVSFHSRLREDRSLHVATIHHPSGTREDVVIPRVTTSQFEKVDDLHSIIGQYQAEAQKAISGLRDAGSPWFKEQTAYVHVWRSATKYLALEKKWQENRFAGDEACFAVVAQFVERYRHLYPYQFNLRQQIILRRRDQFRNVAHRLATSYKEVTLEDVPAEQATHTRKKTQQERNFRYWRRVAARSELRTTINNTCRREGVKVIASGDVVEKTGQSLAVASAV